MPIERKVSTMQAFLQAFHDESTIEIAACSVYYIQKKPRDLDYAGWKQAIPDEIRSTMTNLLACKKCFLEGDSQAMVPICFTYRAAFNRQRIPESYIGSC